MMKISHIRSAGKAIKFWIMYNNIIKTGTHCILGVLWVLHITQITHTTHISHSCYSRYGVATISRLLKIIGLFCRRAL